MGITGIKVMEITETMATTIKAMVDTGAMITRVTTTTTAMVTTAVCNTVCERRWKTKDILYRGLLVLFRDYDDCALKFLRRMHMLVSYMPMHRTLDYCFNCLCLTGKACLHKAILYICIIITMVLNRKGCFSLNTHCQSALNPLDKNCKSVGHAKTDYCPVGSFRK